MVRRTVELVEFNPGSPRTGIGRYSHEIYHSMQSNPELEVIKTGFRRLPLSKQFSILRNFPIAVDEHQKGNIVHFSQIFGSAQMLWNPVHPAVGTATDLGVLVCKEDEMLFNRIDRSILSLQFAGLKRMDRYIAISEATRQDLIEQLDVNPEDVYVTHLGVDHEQFKLTDKTSARAMLSELPSVQFPASIFTLLYVGSELPRKNLSVLFEALAILKQQNIEFQLLKVGSAGADRWRNQTLRRLNELKLLDNVVFTGKVSDDHLALLYSASDLFITTSLLEGFGLPALEAMACGAPVVCSNAGSLPEITGESALLVDPRSAEDVASKIISTMQDTALRQQMSESGIIQAGKFTWEHFSRQLFNAYEGL